MLNIGGTYMDLIKEQLLKLENDLLQPEVRNSMEKLNEILTDNFIEYCSSGYEYHWNKEDEINGSVISNKVYGKIIDFEIKKLSDEYVQATYKMIKNDEPNEDRRYSLRSSIWKYIDGKWKMIFHQGTLVPKVNWLRMDKKE